MSPTISMSSHHTDVSRAVGVSRIGCSGCTIRGGRVGSIRSTCHRHDGSMPTPRGSALSSSTTASIACRRRRRLRPGARKSRATSCSPSRPAAFSERSHGSGRALRMCRGCTLEVRSPLGYEPGCSICSRRTEWRCACTTCRGRSRRVCGWGPASTCGCMASEQSTAAATQIGCWPIGLIGCASHSTSASMRMSVYFNNDIDGHAVHDAGRLREFVDRLEPVGVARRGRSLAEVASRRKH
jgi:hypothetical protein